MKVDPLSCYSQRIDLPVKLKNIAASPVRLGLLCIAGCLILFGFVAEHQPWGRGWWHDFKFYLKQKSPSYLAPDENSPEMQALQQKIDEWYPKIIEQYPLLKVEYKNIPDDQNGFLKILEWQEQLDAQESWDLVSFPDKFNDLLQLGSNNISIPDQKIHEAEEYLKNHKILLNRAMKIGQLPDQSVANISANRYWPTSLPFSSSIFGHLKLKALLEAYRGDEYATLQTLKAILAWGHHLSGIETSPLTIAPRGIALQSQCLKTIHEQIFPLLSDKKLIFSQWTEIMETDLNILNQWQHLLRSEWHIVLKTMIPSYLLSENPRDPIAFLEVYTIAISDLSDPAALTTTGITFTPPAIKLSRKSHGVYEMTTMALQPMAHASLQIQATNQQYQLAFTLKKLEAEGHNLNSLGQQTLDSLPTQILPGLHLAIDFNKRQITAPTETHDTKPVTF